jgi:cell division protein ZapA (FtsZ GTPase activity inhibitor)
MSDQDAVKAQQIVRLLNWMLTEIQAAGPDSQDDAIAVVATIIMDEITAERRRNTP